MSSAALLAELGTGQWLLIGLGGFVAALLLLFWFRPFLLVRIPLWIICHTVYRLRVRGAENVPATGPALLVCNHVSHFDWLFLTMAQKRPSGLSGGTHARTATFCGGM